MSQTSIIANGREVKASLPISIEHFLAGQNLPPRSVVVELNGEALPPSAFKSRTIQAGDKLEVVKIVAVG